MSDREADEKETQAAASDGAVSDEAVGVEREGGDAPPGDGPGEAIKQGEASDATEAESTSSDGASLASEKSAKTRKEQGKVTPKELSEAEIDAPSVQTLIMLGVISLSTLVMWAAGRAACNYQVPGESLTPRKVSLEERTRSSKATGFEFSQLVSCADFAQARSISEGKAHEYLAEQQKACGSCQEQVRTCDKVRSVASVLRANSMDAIIEVKTRAQGGPVVRILGVERRERKWVVSRVFRDPSEAELIPDKDPSALEEPPSPSPGEAVVTPVPVPAVLAP